MRGFPSFAKALLLLPICAGLACSGAKSRPPNVVLIVIDTLRADHLPFYGYGRNTAPFLADLAGKSLLFERAYSTSSWTAPATASIFTSMHPLRHGVLTGIRATEELQKEDPRITFNRIPDSIRTLPEVLREAGYRTFAVTDNVNIDSEMGFDHGFDRFANFHDETAARVNEQAQDWAEEILGASPYFLYLHYMDPHVPYRLRTKAPNGLEEEKRAKLAYDSEIAFVDSKIAELYERFGWANETVVIVTSDHGEELMDRTMFGHGETLYQEVLRVPLLVHWPLRVTPGAVKADVSLLDLLPTLRTIARLQPDPLDEGVDLLVPPAEGRDDRILFAHLVQRRGTSRVDDDHVVRAAVQGKHKYLWTSPGEEALFDLAVDPGETRNLLASDSLMAERLAKALNAYERGLDRFEAEEASMTVDAELREKLRSLGYLD